MKHCIVNALKNRRKTWVVLLSLVMALAMNVGPTKSLHAADQIEGFYKIGMDEASIQEKLRQGKTASLVYGEKIAEIALTYEGQAQGYFDCSLLCNCLGSSWVEGPVLAQKIILGNWLMLTFPTPIFLHKKATSLAMTPWGGRTTHGIYVGNARRFTLSNFGYIEHCDIGLAVNYPITFVSRQTLDRVNL